MRLTRPKEPRSVTTAPPGQPERASDPRAPQGWSPAAWTRKGEAHQFVYPDAQALSRAVTRLSLLPPLVTSWEIHRLRHEIAEAQEGRRFLLQGGDCAETLEECTSGVIANKLKILIQMSLVLVHAGRKPVIRMGRFAGQYAKPRSAPNESRTVNGQEVELPSYFGDLINAAPFTPEARTPDPDRMIQGYQHAALTLNFIRSLCDAGFADLHHPENWDLRFFQHAGLTPELRIQYEAMSRDLAGALKFMEALGERSVDALSRVTFFTSHEALNLHYESALTRRVPRREGWFNLSTHMPWIGERTRKLDGPHIEYFRGIENPVGIKIGPDIDPVELLNLVDTLNPRNEPGKIVLITRLGAANVARVLPPLVQIVRSAGKRVLWICDPMHGNGITTAHGVKTRSFDAILKDLEQSFDVHQRLGGPGLGGVHFELTGEDVTECVGGACGLGEDDLSANYTSLCDPRLNYEQSMELAFLLAGRMRQAEG
ncbi:MAG: 3-deoxy-7-phosphoheptulonate synthase [Phycisphaerales bacterium]|nr:MAG: 3-deoxy-7-phosphoheptulonate synthase [Phycisphaerales bacterium]